MQPPAMGYGDQEELLQAGVAQRQVQGQMAGHQAYPTQMSGAGEQISPNNGMDAGASPSGMLRLPFNGGSPISPGRSSSPRSFTPTRGGAPGAQDFTSSLARTEQIWELALRRLDQKVQQIEQVQNRLDKRVSESSGTVRGLVAEMQSQIKRTDAVDKRLTEFRAQVTAELRSKLADIDSHRDMDFLSRGRATAFDSAAQERLSAGLRNLQELVNARLQPQEVIWEAWAEVSDRLNLLEGACHIAPQPQTGRRRSLEEFAATVQAAQAAAPIASPITEDVLSGGSVPAGEFQTQLNGLSEKLDQILSQAHGDHGWEARLHEHAVRLAGIHSKLEVIRGQPFQITSQQQQQHQQEPLREDNMMRLALLLGELKPQIEDLQHLRVVVAMHDDCLKRMDEAGIMGAKVTEVEELPQGSANLDGGSTNYWT